MTQEEYDEYLDSLDQDEEQAYGFLPDHLANGDGQVQYSIDYINAEPNPEIKRLADRVEDGHFVDSEKIEMGIVPGHIAERIFQITKIDVTGFNVILEARQIEHTFIRHGKNGKADQSMANTEDLAKLEYVLNAPDDIRYGGRTSAYVSQVKGRNRRADTVLYEKAIGVNSYYVVQAVPNTNKKTLYIVTAFIGAPGYKKGALQSTNAKSPDATPEAESAVTPTDMIDDDKDFVKQFSVGENPEYQGETKDVAAQDAQEQAYGFLPDHLSDEDGQVQYSIGLTSKMDYADQLYKIEHRKMNGGHSLYVGVPSESLRNSGFSQKPFVMHQGDYRKARRDRGNNIHYSAHSVPYEFFKEMPRLLNEAPMLIDNGDKVSIVTEWAMLDKKGDPSYVIAGVWRNDPMDNDYVNNIRSVYPYDDFKNKIIKAAESGRLVILNKNKAEQMLDDIGIESSEASRIISLAKPTLSQIADDVKQQFSIGENPEYQGETDDASSQNVQEQETGRWEPVSRENLPTKARDYIARKERDLVVEVTKALGVDRFSDRNYLKEAVRSLSDEFLQTGTISKESMDAVFEETYRQGIVVDAEFYNAYKHVRAKISTTPVTLSKQDQLDNANDTITYCL